MLSGPPPTLATKIWWKDPENRWKGAKWRKSISPTQKRTNMKWGFSICFMWSWRTISCPKWNRKANRQYRKNAQTLNFRRNLRPLKSLKIFTSVSILIVLSHLLRKFVSRADGYFCSTNFWFFWNSSSVLSRFFRIVFGIVSEYPKFYDWFFIIFNAQKVQDSLSFDFC